MLIAIKQLHFSLDIKRLKQVLITHTDPIWPKVSLIVPACNEEKTIGPALSSLLQMDYPNLEVIVVNDRSTDGTGAILENICREYPNVVLVNVTELPPNWLGKVHAQYKAVEQATGDWLLFTDADVVYSKTALQKAVSYCEDNDVEFLTLIPDITAESVALKACMCQFLLAGSLALNISKVQNPKRREAIGCGAFNLVKTSAYKKSRGLEWLKMEVIDDGGFAFMIKENETHSDVLSGLDEIKLEWYPSVRGFMLGLEKNSFSIFQYSLPALTLFTLSVFLWMGGLYLAPFFGQKEKFLPMLCLCFLIYQISNVLVLKKTSQFPMYVVLFLPASMLISLFAVWRSAILFLWRGGVYWRKTFYNKKDLLAHQRVKLLNFSRGKYF